MKTAIKAVLLSRRDLAHLRAVLQVTENDGWYFGNQKHFHKRTTDLLGKMDTALEESNQCLCRHDAIGTCPKHGLVTD